MGTLLAVFVAVALRVPFVGGPVYPDEGGYLLVARQWHQGGPFLYGSLFVDRPPLLLLIFRVCDLAGGIVPLRLLGALLVAVMVMSAGWAGWMISGLRGSRWAAVAGAALASSPLLGTGEVDGELLAAPLVVLSCSLVLAAAHRCRTPARQVVCAFGAGLTAAAAVLVKQNFIDAFVFAGVFFFASLVNKGVTGSIVVRLLGVFSLGAAVPALAAAVWAMRWGTGLSDLWFAMYGFRSQAFEVIMSHSLAAPKQRLHELLLVCLASGIASLAAVFLTVKLRAFRRLEPIAVAVAVMLVVAVASIALGASFWLHYLLELVPSLVLASASLSAGSLRAVRWARAALAFVAVSSVVATVVAATSSPQPSRNEEVVLENWLKGAAIRSDSIVVTYGHANVVEAAGLQPAYSQLWSLPMRTLDPKLEGLESTLAGAAAPTWVIEWDDVDAWGIDDSGRVRSVIATHYREVADVCGHGVYLRDGVRRSAPPPAGCGNS